MGDVVDFTGDSRLDLPVEKVLTLAGEARLTSAIVVGWDEDDRLAFISSPAHSGTALWLLEMAKKHLLDCGDDD